MRRILLSLLATLAATLACTGIASAAGGNYSFDGGSLAQQTQVRAALDASSFNWSLVPTQITIHIARGVDSEASKGNIWIDADLLNSGRFAWGTIQHEYAHQVDFFLLTDEQRTLTAPKLGGSAWWQTTTPTAHAQLTSERFASTLAWAYWNSNDNSMKPANAKDEAAALPPAQFRDLLVSLLGPGAAPTATRTLASAKH